MRTTREKASLPSTRFLQLIRQLCRFSGRDFRLYQAHAACEGLRSLAAESVVLNLPQGTGKTYVSQLVAYAHIRQNNHAKVLVVVPTKELREQYIDMAGWMGQKLYPRLIVVSFDDRLAAIRKMAAVMIDDAHIVVTTPQLFANRLTWFSERSFKAITLCVLDEIDLWPVDDFDEDERVRFHDSFVTLKSRLDEQRTRFFGLTASTLTDRARALLLGDLGCQEIRPFHRSVVTHLPMVRIEPVACFDARVAAMDAEISESSRKLYRRLGEQIGFGVLNTTS